MNIPIGAAGLCLLCEARRLDADRARDGAAQLSADAAEDAALTVFGRSRAGGSPAASGGLALTGSTAAAVEPRGTAAADRRLLTIRELLEATRSAAPPTVTARQPGLPALEIPWASVAGVVDPPGRSAPDAPPWVRPDAAPELIDSVLAARTRRDHTARAGLTVGGLLVAVAVTSLGIVLAAGSPPPSSAGRQVLLLCLVLAGACLLAAMVALRLVVVAATTSCRTTLNRGQTAALTGLAAAELSRTAAMHGRTEGRYLIQLALCLVVPFLITAAAAGAMAVSLLR